MRRGASAIFADILSTATCIPRRNLGSRSIWCCALFPAPVRLVSLDEDPCGFRTCLTKQSSLPCTANSLHPFNLIAVMTLFPVVPFRAFIHGVSISAS